MQLVSAGQSESCSQLGAVSQVPWLHKSPHLHCPDESQLAPTSLSPHVFFGASSQPGKSGGQSTEASAAQRSGAGCPG